MIEVWPGLYVGHLFACLTEVVVCTSTGWRSVHGPPAGHPGTRDLGPIRVAILPFALGSRVSLRSVLIAARVSSPFQWCITINWLHVPYFLSCAARFGPETRCSFPPEPFPVCSAQACASGHGRYFRQCG